MAVAAELKKIDPKIAVIYLGQTNDNLGDIPAQHPAINQVYTVRAGKLRRYHGEGIKQIFDLPTMFKNIRDVFYVLIGFYQSRVLLKEIKPDIIFIKGGYVGVPVGLAAVSLKIPYITHDSDSIPGLANRIIARWAKIHAVALPKNIYSYSQDKTVTTGIPLVSDFEPVTEELKAKYRKSIKVSPSAKLLFIIGGGLGSQRINQAISEAIPHLLHEFKDLVVIHGVGRLNKAQMEERYHQLLPEKYYKRLRIFGYRSDIYRYSGAADVIITRAGATNLAEFSLQGKACIVIPSPFLTGGHQLKNAQVLAKHNAIVMIDESELQDDPNRLSKQVSNLLKDPEKQALLGQQINLLAKPDAAHTLAMLLLEQAKQG